MDGGAWWAAIYGVTQSWTRLKRQQQQQQQGNCSINYTFLKRLPPMRETWVQSLGWEDPLEKEIAYHFSILSWEIPWTEDPGGLQSMGST